MSDLTFRFPCRSSEPTAVSAVRLSDLVILCGPEGAPAGLLEPGSGVRHVLLFTSVQLAVAFARHLKPDDEVVDVTQDVVGALALAASQGWAVMLDPRIVDGRLCFSSLERAELALIAPGGAA